MLQGNYDLDRTYLIQDEGVSGFMTGVDNEGLQYLIKPLPTDQTHVVALVFDRKGNLIDQRFRQIIRQPQPEGKPYLSQLGVILQETKKAFAEENGVESATIQVKHFSLPDWDIGIMEWPPGTFEDVQESLAETGVLPEDEFIQNWAEEKRWVLLWMKDYWMNADGSVGSS